MRDFWEYVLLPFLFAVAVSIAIFLPIYFVLKWVFDETPAHFEARKTVWVDDCKLKQFNDQQCDFMFDLSERARKAQEDADTATMTSGFAIGVAAGSAGSRR